MFKVNGFIKDLREYMQLYFYKGTFEKFVRCYDPKSW